MMKKCIFFLVAMFLLLLNGPSHAQFVDATNPEIIVEIARGFGSATLEKDSSGDPLIRGRIDGVGYGIYFYGCVNGKDCDDIQFAAAWKHPGISLETINDYNRTKRFGKAYLDRERDPVIEMTVNLDFGVSRRNLEDSFDWWRLALKSFTSEVLKK